ncbi:hypothetical protein CK203_036208 [Vitis vinifera]|uniref:Uncharacterized protein n=1 Tax=Vitis vinifera TaxID=29760 RepID=A0A438IWW8_VITVI|nr:hypothetical protein CK203_036208 [Vitis vinifera]
MPGSSLLRLVLSNLFQEEHPPYSFTVSAVGNYYSHQLTSHSCHAILLFIVPALLDLLDLMYEEGTSPFATHPKTMWFTIGCLLAYCLVYGAELSFSSSPVGFVYAVYPAMDGQVAVLSCSNAVSITWASRSAGASNMG